MEETVMREKELRKTGKEKSLESEDRRMRTLCV